MSAQPIDPRAVEAAEEIATKLDSDFGFGLMKAAEQWQEPLARIIQSHFAESVNGKLLEAAKTLCDQLEAVGQDPRYLCVWHLAQSHGIKYEGPFYVDELRALQAAVADAQKGQS